MKYMDKLQQQLNSLNRELNILKRIVYQKTLGGSADIRGRIVAPSSIASSTTIAANTLTQSMCKDDIIGEAELKYETVAITVSAGQSSGTGTATSGSIIIGWRPSGNNDQFVDNIAISGTTVTITLGAAATADNTFVVILIKS